MSVSVAKLENALDRMIGLSEKLSQSHLKTNSRSKKEVRFFFDLNDISPKKGTVKELEQAINDAEHAIELVEQHSPRKRADSRTQHEQGLDQFATKFIRAMSIMNFITEKIATPNNIAQLKAMQKKANRLARKSRIQPRIMKDRELEERQKFKSRWTSTKKTLLDRLKAFFKGLFKSFKTLIEKMRGSKHQKAENKQKLDNSRIVVETPVTPKPKHVPPLNFKKGLEQSQSNAEFIQEKLIGSPAPTRKRDHGRPVAQTFSSVAQTVDQATSRPDR